jgi:hypothetical protein
MSLTLVTGLWNINRDSLNEGWSRSYQHYLDKFSQLLAIDNNLIIFGDSELREFVFKHRRTENTQFIERSLEWFKNNEFFEPIQKIRNNPLWYNQAGWLTDSTQAKLEMYNPLVMSKMFLLHDAKILDSFNSSHLFWIDAGITNTIHLGYLTHDRVIEKLSSLYTHFSFVCFPYGANKEVHGFDYEELCKLARTKTNKVARGGFFGGPKETLSQANSIYHGLLKSTLDKGFMGTEESIFTLMVYQYPELFQYAEIESDGLMGKFFEDLKNNTVQLKHETIIHPSNHLKNTSKPFTDQSALYVLTFNSPKQFETLIESMKAYDSHFLDKTTKYLLDNSTDLSTTPRYLELCSQHGFEHIKKDNLGICGGRQFIAEHFATTNLGYMMFFEDDMFFYPHKGEVCRNGFNRYVDNLYLKIMKIMSREGFDFLKFSFSEFYGDNSKQWSWYNVPQIKREEYWPSYCKLPEQGLDPHSPLTEFKNIQSLEGLAYATGEIYYCNWPQIVSKEGNKKMFLDTKWGHPFEQTWMSYIYQLTKEGKIHPGILLLSPTEHNRFEHYFSSLRKES